LALDLAVKLANRPPTAKCFRCIKLASVLDAVADLVDRILRAKYGVDPSVDKAWHEETRRRIADMEGGKVQGIPLEETLAKARKFTGQ